MSHLQIQQLCKQYGENLVVDHLDLQVEKGEMISLLGPSGCGKTTTLRMIAGLIKPTSGSIQLDGKELTNISTYKRNIGLVFQNYALFPHLNIFNNVAFGLKRRGVPKQEIKDRVSEALELVKLSGFEDRFPSQMSGGQQQRVALARVLVLRPPLVLFDEPLSNLDAKLRQFLRVEIRQLQKKFGFTGIFVTHDQEEAMVLSDRIAVMYDGKITQLGTPHEIYQNPRNSFVADFIGDANMLKIKDVSRAGDQWKGFLSDSTVIFAANGIDEARDSTMMVRPEDVRIVPEHQEPTSQQNGTHINRIRGTIEFIHFIGSEYIVGLSIEEQEKTFVCRMKPDQFSADQLNEGDRVFASWESASTILL